MQPTRRVVLLGAGVSALAACTPDHSARPASPTLDETLRADAVTREQRLVDAYTGALREHPELAPRLTAVLADHTAHLSALRPNAPTATASASIAPLTGRRPWQAVLASLAVLERQAAAAHATGAEQAEAASTCDRVLAPLLASLAAAEASHAVVIA